MGYLKEDQTCGGDELFYEGVENGIAAVDHFAKANESSIETKAEESKFPLPNVPECVNEAITAARTQCLRVTPEEQWALSKQKRAEMADKGDGKGGKTTNKRKRKLHDENGKGDNEKACNDDGVASLPAEARPPKGKEGQKTWTLEKEGHTNKITVRLDGKAFYVKPCQSDRIKDPFKEDKMGGCFIGWAKYDSTQSAWKHAMHVAGW